MKQTTKELYLRKLTSRKFWLTVAGLIGAFCAAVGFGDTVAAQVTAIITAGGLIIAYVFGESLTDSAAVKTNDPADENAPETVGVTTDAGVTADA